MLLIDGNVSDEYEVFDLTGLATRKSIDALGLDISRLKLEKHKNSTTVVLSALAGKGVGLTRFSLCVDDLQAGRLETLFEFHYPANMQYSLVYPERKLGCRKLAVFKGWLRQELAKSPIIRNVS
jgi:LysR family glycine cleavage system transcriptional activator